MLRLLIFLLITGFCQSAEEVSHEITCSDLKNMNGAGWFAKLFLTNSKPVVADEDFPVNFIITSDKNKNLMHVNPGDWSWIKDSWDLYQKTYIIIHGFKSGGEKPWVVNMAKKLVETKKGNVVMVDWSAGSNVFNYANAAKNTQITSKKIARFFDELKRKLFELDDGASGTLWDQFHFIGHSLGAQISAQTSYILKWKSNSWRIERITGLDPAKPCFRQNTINMLKLDKSDADFVDIIHTQVGLGGDWDGLGLKQPIGHMDFYVNSGVVQPKCLGSIFTLDVETMICSHKLATSYFLQSLNMPQNDTCAFRGYAWDGTFMHAQDSLTEKLEGPVCYKCPEMGINADQNKREGTYLVFTSENEPYCKFETKDINDIVRVLWKFKGSKSIFDM